MGRIDPGFWLDRRVLLNGHTGFKGAWLTLWLTELGALVTGLSLPPRTRPSLFALAASGRAANIFGDISAYAVVLRTVADCDPEVIIHGGAGARAAFLGMAARQPGRGGGRIRSAPSQFCNRRP